MQFVALNPLSCSRSRASTMKRTSVCVGACVCASALTAAAAALNAPGFDPAGRKLTGTIKDISNIVIFMQENRPIDMYMGTLRGIRGFGDRATPPLPTGRSPFYQPIDPNNASAYMLPFHLDANKTSAQCLPAPRMDYPTDIAMWDSGRMDAWNTARAAGFGMGYFKREDLPFYYALWDAFTVGDQYFQSTFTQTNPNRLHLFSGSNGLSVGQFPVLDNTEPVPGFTWETVAETLQKANVSWRVFQAVDNFDDNGFAWFATFQNAQPGSVWYDYGMYRADDLVAEFAAAVMNDSLPQVSILIAPTNQSEHATWHPAAGEDLSAQLVKALSANPAVYAKTAFLLMYDEGGQWFDHHWTPTPPVSQPEDGLSTVNTTGEIFLGMPIGLGFRVPLTVISPWSRGGYVVSEVFDHTSVLRFVEARFGVHFPNISPWRRAITGDLTSAFDFANPDFSWPNLPDTGDYPAEAEEACGLPLPIIPAAQAMPVQEPGTRPARPLPYEFVVSDAFVTSGPSVQLTIAVTGQAGAVFYLYNHLLRTLAPRKYSLAAGTWIVDALAGAGSNGTAANGMYAVSLHGPNGFVRYFSGSVPAVQPITGPSPALRVFYDVISTAVIFELRNDGAASAVATMTDNAYGAPQRSFPLAARAATNVSWAVAASANWYDVTVSVPVGASNWVRRAMGRMENGKPTTSDPASADTGLLAGGGSGTHHEHPLLPRRITHQVRETMKLHNRGLHKDARYMWNGELQRD